MLTLNEALKNILSLKRTPGTEYIQLEKSVGRVLAEDIFADRDYPPFNRSAMDGYAVNSEDVIAKKLSQLKVVSEVYAGDNTNFPLRSGEAVKIMTGAVVPDLTDIVIRKEDIESQGEFISFKNYNFRINQNIALKGEDVKKSEMIIPRNIQINYRHLSTLASVGKSEVKVYQPLRVGIISTGYEIKRVDSNIDHHQIRDSNSYSITGFLSSYSIRPLKKIMVTDDLEKIKSAIRKMLDFDILITTGGVSAGEADLVPNALRECGAEEIFHKVKIKPGKPVWFGYYPGGARIFALPGNPFSVQAACKIFLEPFIRACFNLQSSVALSIPLKEDKKKRSDFDEFFPAKLIKDSCMQLQPLTFNGSGDITALNDADGIAHHPSDLHDIGKGTLIKFYSFSNI